MKKLIIKIILKLQHRQKYHEDSSLTIHYHYRITRYDHLPKLLPMLSSPDPYIDKGMKKMKMVKILSLCVAATLFSSCASTNSCNSCSASAAASRPANTAITTAPQHHAAKSAVKKLPNYSYSGKSLTQRKKDETKISA